MPALFKYLFMIAVINITFIQTTSAVFFTGEALKPQVLKKEDVTVVILGDAHEDIDPNLATTNKQHTDLLGIAKKHNAYLIVEDTATFESPEGVTPHFMPIKLMHDPTKSLTPSSPLARLCITAANTNIKNVNIECRNAETFSPTPPVMHRIIQFEDPAFQTYLKKFENKNKSDSLSYWLELNTVYEFAKALQSKKYKLIIIAVGAGHLKPISEMIQQIYNFKVTFQKNLYKNIEIFGSTEKNLEMGEKKSLILQQHALDLPQFFQEALKAQPIRSRL